MAVSTGIILWVGLMIRSGTLLAAGLTAAMVALTVWLGWKLGKPFREFYRRKP